MSFAEANISDPTFRKLIDDSSADPNVIARHLESRVLALNATSTARAFEVGSLLGIIQDREFYRQLGFANFQDFCKARNLAKTTVYRDMAVSKQFSLAEHGHLGITRLRLLVNREDAVDLIEHGISREDGTREPLIEIKSRDLQARLKALPQSVEPELDEAVQVLLGTTVVTEENGSTQGEGGSGLVKSIAAYAVELENEGAASEPAPSMPLLEASGTAHQEQASTAAKPVNSPPFPPDHPIWAKVC